MELYELILKNSGLTFIDAVTGRKKTIADIHQSLQFENERALVLIYSNNSLASIEVLLNFFSSDLAVMLLDEKLDISFKNSIESKYRPYYIFDPGRNAVEGYEPTAASDEISLFRSIQSYSYPIHEKIKLLLSTSGSTGSPKFVKLSDENLTQNALSILEYMPIEQTDVVPVNVPVVFVFGLSIFTTNCIRGGTIVCTNKDIFQKDFWTDFEMYGFSTMGGVPYFYEMLHRIGFFKKDHPSLRYLTHTGGLMNANTLQVIAAFNEQFNKQFIIQYGQTEAAGRMAHVPAAAFALKGGSVGQPVMNGSFDIHPETRELIYSGPNVFGGYAVGWEDLRIYQQPQRLHTGDIGRMDEDGFYYVEGRIKRIMKLHGIRINLDEVELILKNSFGGTSFVCLNQQDNVLVVIHHNEMQDEQAIRSLLLQKMKIHARSVKIIYIVAFPVTPNGKVDYPEITRSIGSS